MLLILLHLITHSCSLWELLENKKGFSGKTFAIIYPYTISSVFIMGWGGYDRAEQTPVVVVVAAAAAAV